MTVHEARNAVTVQWRTISEQALGCPVQIDDAQTEEYEWGWSFYFVPTDPGRCRAAVPCDRYAVDRVTGIATPVGSKGIPDAVRYLMDWRRKRAEAGQSG